MSDGSSAKPSTEQSANCDCVTVESGGVLPWRDTQAVGPTLGRGLTRAQARALLYVSEHWQAHGFSPSFENVRQALGIASKSGVSRILHALVAREYLQMDPARARSMRLTPAAVEWFRGLGDSKTALAA
jgi:hypothetical protein